MEKIPFEQQRLRQTVLQRMRGERDLGHELRGEDLLALVEEAAGKKLPPEVRDLFSEFSAPANKRRGRRPNDRGVEDFVLERMDRIYHWLLRRFKKDGHGQSSERAYEFLAERVRFLSNKDGKSQQTRLGWEGLRNMHTQWKRGCLHLIEHCVDSEDYEAAIDEQFPSARRS